MGTERGSGRRGEKRGCEGCRYFGGYNRFSACCNYLLMTGKRRPCGGGKSCSVREEEGTEELDGRQRPDDGETDG